MRPCLSSYHHSTSPTRPLHSQATRHCPRSLNTNIPSLSHHVSTIPSPLPALSPPFVRCTSASAPPGSAHRKSIEILAKFAAPAQNVWIEICGGKKRNPEKGQPSGSPEPNKSVISHTTRRSKLRFARRRIWDASHMKAELSALGSQP